MINLHFENTSRLHGFLSKTQRSCSNINKRPSEGAKQLYKMASTIKCKVFDLEAMRIKQTKINLQMTSRKKKPQVSHD